MENTDTTSGATCVNVATSGAKAVKWKYGKTNVKNYSLLHIYGDSIEDILVSGSNFNVEFAEMKSQD